jgi:hypothetical protein
VPAIGSVVVTAAGEDGHPGIKAQAEPVRKLSISLRRVARVHAARPGLGTDPPPIARLGVTIADRYKQFSFTIA